MIAKIIKILRQDLPAYIRQYGLGQGLTKLIQTKTERWMAIQDSKKVQLLKTLLAFKQIIIVSTPHCLFIAHSFKQQFLALGFTAEITDKYQADHAQYLHIVIAPQIFKTLPQHYIAFQMEQSVSSRWFTKRYFRILRKALLIFDYSQENINFLLAHGIKLKAIHFMPLGFNPDYSTCYALPQARVANKKYDLIFYGDTANKRRQNIIQDLSKSYPLKVCTNVFGQELANLLVQSKIVINIHYYEQALLETTRIYESLSLNTLVISECSSDQSYYDDLEDIVEFVPINDLAALNNKIRFWLQHPIELDQKIHHNRQKLLMRRNLFQDYFQRFLAAYNIVDYQSCHLLAETSAAKQDTIVPIIPFYCLSIPETSSRTREFMAKNTYKVNICAGIKHLIGWLGCGMSFQYIIHQAQQQNCEMIIICEDDALFTENFANRLEIILQYLKLNKKKWDIYSGMMVDVTDDTDILAIEYYQQEKFVFLNRIISMVFNIYNISSYSKIMQWNEYQQPFPNIANTIDEYIKNSNLRFVTSYPFLVGHKENASSTLWGNNVKNKLIYQHRFQQGLTLLENKIKHFETRGINEIL